MANKKDYDFSGWATRNDLKCSDGRVIKKDAFKDCDGKTVPLVWNHDHGNPLNVLGHALLENRDEGVYTYCSFNNTESGNAAKTIVEHEDVCSLSIYANHLKQQGASVLHGAIREVSLVLAGANPGAFIDSIIRHGEELDDEAVIYTGEPIEIMHADEEVKEEPEKEEKPVAENEEKKAPEEGEETVQDVFNTLNEKQKKVVYAMIGMALQAEKKKEDGDEKDMKHNVFDENSETKEEVLSHSDMEAIFSDMRRYGSLKDSVLNHGITNVDYLFPDEKNVTNTPIFIQRDMGWVQKVMGAVHHTPFSRIKSMFADITGEDARALGYQKGKLKKDEVFALLKRTTTPTTVYKKQKMDRDDVIDITDFDIVAWLKSEMRMMLDEELARAFLIGDGRNPASDDKISEQNIRPIMTDAELYTIQKSVAQSGDENADAKAFIRAAVKARKDYKGSGSPTLYTTEDVLTSLLLIEDLNGRVIYEDEAKLARALRVKEIVTIPVMEGVKGPNGGDLLGIIVNLTDYNVGADKGGAVNMFDDFDIDYNAQKYLIETRCSGALIKPYSAIVLEAGEGGTQSGGAKLTVDDDIPYGVSLLGATLEDLQSAVSISGKGIIYGSLNNVINYTGFSGDPEEQSGHYIALHIEAVDENGDAVDPTTMTVQVIGGKNGPSALDNDKTCIFRITDPTKQSIEIKTPTTTKRYLLSGVRLLDTVVDLGEG